MAWPCNDVRTDFFLINQGNIFLFPPPCLKKKVFLSGHEETSMQLWLFIFTYRLTFASVAECFMFTSDGFDKVIPGKCRCLLYTRPNCVCAKHDLALCSAKMGIDGFWLDSVTLKLLTDIDLGYLIT